MAMAKMVRVSSKGQIVLPKRVREKLEINEGDYLFVAQTGDDMLVISKSAGSLLDTLLEPLRREAEAQGFTREELMEMIKDMRKQQKTNAA